MRPGDSLTPFARKINDNTLYQWTDDRSRTGGHDAGGQSRQRQAFSKVFMARPEHMTRAIDAAYAVKDVWGNTLPSERELILIRAADVLESMRGEVVDLLIEEGRLDIRQVAVRSVRCRDVLRSAAGECRRIMGQTIPCDVPGRISMAIRRPAGSGGRHCAVQFSVDPGDEEGRLRAGRRQYLRAEAVGRNLAGRTEDRRDFRQSRSAAGSAQCGDRRWSHARRSVCTATLA